MKPEQYLVDSERTLAKFPEGVALSSKNAEGLGCLIDAVIRQCRLLDGMKKHIFYGKPFDLDAAIHELAENEKVILTTQVIENLSKFDERETNLLHAAMGKLTEAGEVMENVYDYISSQEQNYDAANTVEEVGDGWWYDAILLRDVGESVEGCMSKNINKLVARYPDKFNSDDAINRDTEAEKKAMESDG